jgi:hypothetical protein
LKVIDISCQNLFSRKKSFFRLILKHIQNQITPCLKLPFVWHFNCLNDERIAEIKFRTLQMAEIKNGKKIYDWVARNHAPCTWNYIAVKIGDHFLENEINPFTILQTTEFGNELVKRIDQILKNHCDSGLPNHLLN